jgi:N-acyl amino acid synthase of PEP-CTERM/exosortase system
MIEGLAAAAGVARSYADHFEVCRAKTPALLDQAYRLRYQVYCLEHPFENAAEHGDGREIDPEDDRSAHTLLLHRKSGAPVGTARVILPLRGARGRPLPIERILAPGDRPLLAALPADSTAEVSRFAVSKLFRRRRGEQLYPDAGFAEANAGPDERRLMPYITFGLLRGVFEICLDEGISHLCAVMDPALLRILDRIGLDFTSVGGLVEHHGRRQPCYAPLAALIEQSSAAGSLLWQYLGETMRRPEPARATAA